MNILSLSDMMMEGMPCSLYTLAKKAWATDKAVYGWAKQIKCAYLVSLSMTTKIVSKLLDLGRPSMKSRLMVCQACVGTGSGYNKPGNLQCSGLAWAHTSQALI